MPIKVTMFFDFAKSGWSETHYYMPDSQITAANQAAAFKMAQLRAGLLGGQVVVNGLNMGQPFLNWIRMSLDGVFRDSELVTNDQTEIAALQLGTNWTTQLNAGGVYRNLSLRCRGQGDNLTKRAIMYLGGLPDSVFTGDTSYSFNNPLGFQNSWIQFQKEMTSGRWGFRCSNNAAPVQVVGVTSEAAQPSRLQLNMGAAFAPTVGSDIQLRNFTATSRAFRPLNGHFFVAAVNPTGGINNGPLITLAGTENRDPSLVFRLGTAEISSKAPVAYAEFFALGPSSRKRGVGLGSPVGRKRQAKQYAG